MTDTTLAQLMAQAEGEGASLATLHGLVEEAVEAGAVRALARLGLSDERAGEDVRELRGLLGAWRVAKRSAIQSAVAWAMRGLCAFLLAAIALKLGVGDKVRL